MMTVATPNKTIQEVITAGLDVTTTIGTLTHVITGFMDSMEASTESGASKKKWVLAQMRDYIYDNGMKWQEWYEKIAQLIDSVKTIWNFITGRTKI